MYSTTAPLLGLPCARQAQKIRSADTGKNFYMPGFNNWVFQQVSMRSQLRPLQNGMDGTRIIRSIELYHEQYLVGKEFPPDVRLFEKQIIEVGSMASTQNFVLKVRQKNEYAAEAYSYNLSDTSGLYPDVLTGSIPEAKSGVNGEHILAQMFEVEKKCFNLPLIGHCTDSASNALKGLILLASPATYHKYDSIKYVGLPLSDYCFFAPVLRPPYPSIAYPCWDHSGRTVLRNLMNENITIVCAKLPASKDGMQHYLTASIQDLLSLKACKPNVTVKYSDIYPHIKQNCDATTRVLTKDTIQELAQHVPESKGTQLFLQACVWTHEPYRNSKFGSPPDVVKSLWAGLMTWHRWRSYVKCTDGLTLTDNFISYAHYMTEELLVHAGINHQLALFSAFPHLDPTKDYSMRNTGNRGIEAVHSIFRGGSSSLPITAPNLTFKEFLNKMNTVSQVQKAEHALKMIDGHSIVASKKKRLTCARTSTDKASERIDTYTKPEKYSEFIEQLVAATKLGDSDSKKIISELAPQMADTLKKEKEWDNPTLAIEVPKDVHLLDDNGAQVLGLEKFNELIEEILGPVPMALGDQRAQNAGMHSVVNDVDEVLANLMMDMESMPLSNDDNPKPRETVQLLKNTQPHQERPSKDRSRHFIVKDLPFDTSNSEHNISLCQLWTAYPMDKIIRAAKFFLLCNISYIAESGKLRNTSIKANPNTKVILNMYKYDYKEKLYTVAGRSALLPASVLHHNVTDVVLKSTEGIRFDHSSLSELSAYSPYHPDIDLPPPSSMSSLIPTTMPHEDPYIVEKIVSKRFNAQKVQYEYLIKWQGYSSKENTWELPSNLPALMLNEYEKSLLTASSSEEPKRAGLHNRTKIKAPNRPDFIVNM